MRWLAPLAAALAVLSACASAPPPLDEASLDEQRAHARDWRESFAEDPVTAAIAACAQLREGSNAFDDRLIRAGFGASPAWRGSPERFLEAPRFIIHRDGEVGVKVAANRVNDTVVCVIDLEGELGPAVWEVFRQRFERATETWRAESGDQEGPRRFTRIGGSGVETVLFALPTRKAPHGLMVELIGADRRQ